MMYSIYDYLMRLSDQLGYSMQCKTKRQTKITLIYTVPSISIGTVKTKLLCWLLSQDIYKYDKKKWIWDKITEFQKIVLGDSTHTFYQLRRSALLEFIPLSDVSRSIGTVASRVFLSDQLCPVALILQILKAGNVSYQLYPLLLHSESHIRQWHTQTRMKTRELILREKQAIWMLKEKRKSIRALTKTKGMEKSRVWKPPATAATNNDLIGWENNSSRWQTNHKCCENEPQRTCL